MKRIAVYGSLKEGKYNNFIIGDFDKVGTIQVTGTLYRVSSYPALLEEGDNSYAAEVYDVDEETYERVKRMEIGAGYKETTVNGCIVYYADEGLAQYCRENCEVINSY